MLNKVMEDESAIPVLEDEAIQFECLLVEPQDDHVSVDAFLCFHRNSPEKCMEMEDVPCKFGGLNFGTGQDQERQLGQQVLDIKPSEIEAGKFQSPNGPSGNCEDYLLDVEYGDDHGSSIGLQKLVSGSHNQADRADDNGISQKSDSSGTTSRVHNCQEDLDMNDSESHDIFSCIADSEMSLEDRWFKYPTLTIQNMEEDVSGIFSERNNKSMSFTPGLTSGGMLGPLTTKQESEHASEEPKENEEPLLGKDASPAKSPNQASNIGTCAEKRLRKPPQRFIDELSEPESKSSRKRREGSTPTSKGKFPRISYHKHCDTKSRTEKFLSEDSAGKAIQVPFAPVVQKESQTSQVPVVTKVKMESHHKKESRTSHVPVVEKLKLESHHLKESRISHVPVVAKVKMESHHQKESRTSHVPIVAKVLQSDKETFVDESEEDYVAEVKLREDGGKRKHHILWTVSEVRKLIDGVSRYGVGRWSRIKKDLFPSSAHRTPVDLKDKWRNLLKASGAQRESKRGEDRKRNLAWRPLPKSILRRVSELSTIYPYPRELRSKR